MIQVSWAGKEQLEIVEQGFQRTALNDHQVRLRITAAGICGTDIHIWEGRLPFAKAPLVLGHEFAGVVEECGPGVDGLSAGDRVKCDSVVGCGVCNWCQKGATQFCPDGWEFGITRDGGWADRLIVPDRNLHRLPDAVTDEVAAILDVEVYGAFRKPGVFPGDTVAVVGAGPAGLIALQCARVLGAGRVIVSDFRSERLALAKRLGADYIVNVNERQFVEEVKKITNGRGVDLAFDAAGTERSFLDLLRVLRPQGRGVLYGVPESAIAQFPLQEVILKDITLYGSLSDRTGWDEVIELVATGRIDLKSLITHRFPLRQAVEALPMIRDPRFGAVKGILLMDPHKTSIVNFNFDRAER
jgi:threonine dehydrogenase-like Zn-dependent dehydrogenase